jgi:hypothetical protein
MPYTVKVEASDEVQTWGLFLDEIPIEDFNEDGEASLELTPGEHFFYYDVRGAGGKVTISLEGDPEVAIIEPEGEWPFEVEVPADRPGKADRFYVRLGQ